MYLLLEKSVSEVPIIQAYAHSALASLSQTYSYSSTSELISDNMDYLTNAILTRIRHLHRHPKAITVLQAALDQSTPGTVPPDVWKIVTFILDKLDDYHSVAALPFVIVLGVVVQKVAAATQNAVPVSISESIDSPVDLAVKYLKNGFNFPANEEEADENSTPSAQMDSSLDLAEQEQEQEEAEPEVPQSVLYTVEVRTFLYR